jgi:hypothetical protein
MMTADTEKKCGTVAGAFADAPEMMKEAFQDIVKLMEPWVRAVVRPKVEHKLMNQTVSGFSEDERHWFENLPEDIPGECLPEAEGLSDIPLSPRESELRRFHEFVCEMGGLDPKERENIALDVSRDETRRLVRAWFSRLEAITGFRQFRTVVTWESVFPGKNTLTEDDCRHFEVLTCKEANAILVQMSSCHVWGKIQNLAYVYLVL